MFSTFLTAFLTAKIADMYTKLNASRSYVYAVARACDAGKVSRRVSSLCLLCYKGAGLGSVSGLFVSSGSELTYLSSLRWPNMQ